MLLTQILARRGVLTEEVATEAPQDPVSNDLFVRQLLDKKTITPAQFTSARAAKLGIPFVDFTDYEIDTRALALVPGELCRRHEVIPLKIHKDKLYLAMSNSGDIIAIDDVRAAIGLPVLPVLAERNDLQAAMMRYFRMDDELKDLSSVIEEEQTGVIDLDSYEAVANDAPIVRFVNLIISQAITDRASDIHIEPGDKDLRIRYRIDGVLHEMKREPKLIQSGVTSRIKIMSDIDIAERRKPQDGRMTFGHGEEARDLRVATLPTVWGENIVMRILDNGSVSHSIENLGMLEHNRSVFDRATKKTSGMILVTGPTGSGKSTTLYATLKAVARPEVNIITVEDPVEYRMPDINQIQVNPKAGLTFASALRSILRADPDIVLVGEIRDRETAQIAMEASLTGHLVLSTLHTNDAPSSITRLIELGVEPFLVGSSVSAVVAQRLARKLCSKCKAPADIDQETLISINFVLNPSAPPTFYRPVGCASCSHTGYRGRLAFHEVMEMSEGVVRLTLEHSSSAEIGKAAMLEGMIRIRQDGLAKAAQGLTSIEEVFRVTD